MNIFSFLLTVLSYAYATGMLLTFGMIAHDWFDCTPADRAEIMEAFDNSVGMAWLFAAAGFVFWPIVVYTMFFEKEA